MTAQRLAPVALIQLNAPAEPSAGLAHAEPLIREAAASGARLVVTPEGSNFLEQSRSRRATIVRREDEDPAVRGFRALAAELGLHLLVGSAIVRHEDEEESRSANRSLLIGPDGVVRARYDKMHVYDVDLPTGERHRESESIRPGDRAVVAQTPWGGLGLAICYDVRFPHLFRALARGGADMIAVPAAFTVPTGEAHWETLLRARAIETGAFILAAAQGGHHQDGRSTWGRTTAVGPWGEILGRIDHDRPGVLRLDLDLSAPGRARAAIRQLDHDREFIGP